MTFVSNSWLLDEVISIVLEYVPAVIYMALSWLRERYREALEKVKIGAELLFIAEAAKTCFLSLVVIKLTISLI